MLPVVAVFQHQIRGIVVFLQNVVQLVTDLGQMRQQIVEDVVG